MLQILWSSVLCYHGLSSGQHGGWLKIERDIKSLALVEAKLSKKFSFTMPQRQAMDIIYTSLGGAWLKTKFFLSCCCHVFRDIDETSTEGASLELDSPG